MMNAAKTLSIRSGVRVAAALAALTCSASADELVLVRGADGTDERGDEGVFCIRVQPGNSTSPLCNISQASLST